MFNDYEIYMLSKLKIKEMNELQPLQIPLSKKDKSNNNLDQGPKLIDMNCCPTVCC